MKKTNKKLMIPVLASILGVATVGAVTFSAPVSVSADEVTYSLTDVFAASENAKITAKKLQDSDEKETTVFTLANGSSAWIKRDLALKWFERKAASADDDNASYFTVKFAFDELNFDSVEFVMESEASVATEEDKAVNSVKFAKDGDKYYAIVLNGETESVKQEVALAAKTEYTLSLAGGEEADEFKVLFNGAVITNDVAEADGTYKQGALKNVGAYFSDYTYEEMYPLTVKAETAEGVEASVFLTEINNQQFDELKKSETSADTYLVVDNAAPVLVVNEDLNGFQLGTQFSLSYERIDVLQSSLSSPTMEYYQWNPADDEAKYLTLNTSKYFMDTTYYTNGTDNSKTAQDGYTATSVYSEFGEEYVAIRFTLKDNADNSKEYDLAWYTSYETVEEIDNKNYIVVGRSKQGATYSYITADEATKTNIVDTAKLNAKIADFEAALNKAADDIYAGSNSYLNFPSFAWFIEDDNGYRNLKFTISYKKPSSTSASTSSSLSPSALKLAAAEEGEYEFKIFATDKAGNAMKYYLDGELVDVTSSNVWDIEEIPSFTYRIKNQGLKVEEPSKASDRKVSKILDQTYTLSGITVVGSTSEKSAFALYRVNLDKYNNTVTAASAKLSTSMLSTIKYEDVQKEVKGKLLTVTDGNYFELYVNAYASILADKVGADVEKVKLCFTEIQEYNSRITEDDAEWEAYNKYKWQPSSKSFVTAEEGEYLILCDYWEEELPMQRAVAYKHVSVASESDVIKGETEWLKNNIVSVVLFAIAGVMLILIVILLLVNPSDETLEDLDEKEEKGEKENEK